MRSDPFIAVGSESDAQPSFCHLPFRKEAGTASPNTILFIVLGLANVTALAMKQN